MKRSKTKIQSAQIKVLRSRLNQPFRTALGDHPELENYLIKLRLSDGNIGLGEAAVASHISGEGFKPTGQYLRKAAGLLKGADAADYLTISRVLHQRCGQYPSVIAAVEMAVLDALTRHLKIPLWKFFGPKCHLLKSDITLVIADMEETEQSLRKFYKAGFRAFKVKIGRDFDLDVKRMRMINRLAKRSSFILDANQGYDAGQMMAFLKEMRKARIVLSLLEQPVPRDDWEGLKKITRFTSVPVCADESVRTLDEAVRAVKERAVDVINIKTMKHGFIVGREIAELATRHNIKLMIGGMMESSLAMTASAHMAAGLGCFKYIDLDTPFFIRRDPFRGGALSPKGVYDLRNIKSGIGVYLRS